MAAVIFAGVLDNVIYQRGLILRANSSNHTNYEDPLTMQWCHGSPYPLVLGNKCNPKHPVFWHNSYAYLNIRNQFPLPTFSWFENVFCITYEYRHLLWRSYHVLLAFVYRQNQILDQDWNEFLMFNLMLPFFCGYVTLILCFKLFTAEPGDMSLLCARLHGVRRVVHRHRI